MPVKYYYGKKTEFLGKTLFEILANLRNFGVGRMVIKYEELLRNQGKKSYYIIKKVEPVMDSELKEGAVYAERIFRNARVPGLSFVEDETWHTDWQLVPKDEEHKYLIHPDQLVEHGHPSTYTVLPRWMPVPPLMDIFLRRHYELKGQTSTNVKMDTDPMQIRMNYPLERISRPHDLHRIAEEGEEPTVQLHRPLQSLLKFRPGVKVNNTTSKQQESDVG